MHHRFKYASQEGGKYLETLNKFDVLQLTPDEWNQFIKIICDSYEVPF